MQRDAKTDLGRWRRQIKGSMIRNPSTSLTRVWVCCSYCGYGKLTELATGGTLHKAFGLFFVQMNWSLVLSVASAGGHLAPALETLGDR